MAPGLDKFDLLLEAVLYFVRVPPFLLYVRCKSGVTFIRRSFRDERTRHFGHL